MSLLSTLTDASAASVWLLDDDDTGLPKAAAQSASVGTLTLPVGVTKVATTTPGAGSGFNVPDAARELLTDRGYTGVTKRSYTFGFRTTDTTGCLFSSRRIGVPDEFSLTAFIGFNGSGGWGANGQLHFTWEGVSNAVGKISTPVVNDGAWHVCTVVVDSAAGTVLPAHFTIMLDGQVAATTNVQVGTVTAPLTTSRVMALNANHLWTGRDLNADWSFFAEHPTTAVTLAQHQAIYAAAMDLAAQTPAGLVVTGHDTGFYASWEPVSGATGYEYRVNGGTPVTVATGKPYVSVQGLPNDTPITVEVRGTGGAERSAWATAPQVTPLSTARPVTFKARFSSAASFAATFGRTAYTYTGETVADGKLTVTLSQRAVYLLTLADLGLTNASVWECELELAALGTNNSMLGPVAAASANGNGVAASWYNNGIDGYGWNITGWAYSSTAVSGASPGDYAMPSRVRMRRSGNSYFMRVSKDGGATWSPEITWTNATVIDRIGFGNVYTASSVEVTGFTIWGPARPTVAPLNLTAHAFGSGALVTWAKNDQSTTSWDVRVNGGAVTNVTFPQHVLTGLTNDTAATVEVREVNAVGVGPWGSVSVTPFGTKAFADAFSRPDSTTSLGSAPTGQAWTAGAGTWGITGGQGYPVTSTAESHAYVPGLLAADFDLMFQPGAMGDYDVMYRYADANNQSIIRVSSATQIQLVHRNGGTWGSPFLNVNNLPSAPNPVVRLIAKGRMLYLYRNGVLIGAAEDPTSGYGRGGIGLRTHLSTAARFDWIVARDAPASIPGVPGSANLREHLGAAGTRQNGSWAYKGRDSKTADTGSAA